MQLRNPVAAKPHVANIDYEDDKTVVIYNKSQKEANIDNESLAVEYAISDSGATCLFLVEGAPC